MRQADVAPSGRTSAKHYAHHVGNRALTPKAPYRLPRTGPRAPRKSEIRNGETDGETEWRSLTAPNGRQIVAVRRPAMCAGSSGCRVDESARDRFGATVPETSQAASVIGLPSEHFPPFGAPEGPSDNDLVRPPNVIDLGVEVVLQIAVLVLHGEAPIAEGCRLDVRPVL